MTNENKYSLTPKEKEAFMAALVPQLSILRTKAEISQEDLANLIGVSRQTYGSVERQAQKLTWNTYLSLILFYDYNEKTHDILRAIGAFPEEVVSRFNNGNGLPLPDFEFILGKNSDNILRHLDSQALHAIKTVIMLEYARCTNTPGDAVVRSFNGATFEFDVLDKNLRAKRALDNIMKKDDE